ncbi:uncharacterized protein LOC114787739 [Denticeps clupeoides]|uniref:uncharacterized protein LOC114787739 n=1 Tax=Denticeps clupeoides TaxID=299321 RepID=UPI0010A3AF19|nr:uncharacterized protein LOC114787739 [Denticeps clupeoides]
MTHSSGGVILVLLAWLLPCEAVTRHQAEICNPACADVQQGRRHTFRYSMTVSTGSQAPSAAASQLALDCVVDIDTHPKCPLMVMKLRNPQMKRSSSQREPSLLRQKSLRESLEKQPLRFALREGRVATLCPQAAEQVWTLNIKRAILSMLQTSHTGRARERVEEEDVYGFCPSSYERRGGVVRKSRELTRCHQHRLSDFWKHSVPLKENQAVAMTHQCTQQLGPDLVEKVNCTETVAVVLVSGLPGIVQSRTVSTLTLLRTLENVPVALADTRGSAYLTDLKFEEDTGDPARGPASDSHSVLTTIRRLCSHMMEQQQQSELFLSLVVRLRTLSSQQLRSAWHEGSFKCRDDWQPLLDAVLSCGSEGCIRLLTDLFLNHELEEHRAPTFLAFVQRPTPPMVASANALLLNPEIRQKVLLSVSALVHQLCQRELSPCTQIPEVQEFIGILKASLEEEVTGMLGTSRMMEMLRILKAVGNSGLAAAGLIDQLGTFLLNHSAPVELRLVAIQAFRRIPCSANRTALVLLYQTLQEDVEVRIAAYQQLMRCADQKVFSAIRDTLDRETSSQVGAFVWSHLTHLQKTEDPLKWDQMRSLPDDIISRDFEAETWKFSSYMDSTMDLGLAAANVEGVLVFSPASFLPRSLMANLTVHAFGRAFNLLEMEVRAENMEPLMKYMFGGQVDNQDRKPRFQEAAESLMKGTGDPNPEGSSKNDGDACKQQKQNLFRQARAKFTGRKSDAGCPQCWISMKVFGNELTFLACSDLTDHMGTLSLSMAGLAVKLLKGNEVRLSHRAFVLAKELLLPSLSGFPIRLALNMSSLLSLRLKGGATFKDWSHFSLAGFIKPNMYVGTSAHMGVGGALGPTGLEWVSRLKSSTSLDGSIQLERGQAFKVVFNTPEDVMDLLTFSSKIFRVSGDTTEELSGLRNRMEKTTCTPKAWSKLVGWQLCSEMSYPSSLTGKPFPPPGPVTVSLRALKLDRGLHQYLLEALYAAVPQRDTWLPQEVNLLLSLRTPLSTVQRDMAIELSFSVHRLVLKITHPQKSLLIQGQLDQVKSVQTVKAELLVDNFYHYYLKGLMDTVTLPTERRQQYRLEAKVTTDGRPIILSVDFIHGLNQRTSMSVVLENVLKDTASFSVQLERRQEAGHRTKAGPRRDVESGRRQEVGGRRQYSIEAELVVPSLLQTNVLGLLEHRGPEWSSALRLRYSTQEEGQNLHRECHMTQSLMSEAEPKLTYHMRAEHQLHCSHVSSVNHKIQIRHERSPSHSQSSLDVSYGKHWDQQANKQRIILNHSLQNQSRPSSTSYALEFGLQVLEQAMNYRMQLLHTRLQGKRVESSTHLKLNYNQLLPLVVGLHLREPGSRTSQRKWEGTFNMDSPWLYVYLAQKMTQSQRGGVEITSELTTQKLVNIHSLVLQGTLGTAGREKEARLQIFTPTVTYLKVEGQGSAGKRGLRASGSFSTAWTPVLQGALSLENGKQLKTLELVGSLNKHNINLSTSVSMQDKKLKKRLVSVNLVVSELRGSSVQVKIEGGVEELKKDRKMYQKRVTLHLRHPFQFLPPTLLLQATFTSNLKQQTYNLHSRLVLPASREATHTLTVGYEPHSPFVCSFLVHPFSGNMVPQHSKICVSFGHGQNHRELQGTFQVNKTDRMTVHGKVQFSEPDSGQTSICVTANITQEAQELQMSTSASLEGIVSWRPFPAFNCQLEGRATVNQQQCQLLVRLNRTLSGVGLFSALSQPFSSPLPRSLQVDAAADLSPVSGSLSMRADGMERVWLNVRLAHSHQARSRVLDASVAVHQSLVPSVTRELRLEMAANISTERQHFQTHWLCALEHLSGSGSLHQDPLLDQKLLVEGQARSRSGGPSQGQLKLSVNGDLHSLEFSHQGVRDDTQELESHDWLCVRSADKFLCVNVSSSSRWRGGGSICGNISHTFPWMQEAGLPLASGAGLSWALDLRAVNVSKDFQVSCSGGGRTGHLQGRCSGNSTGQTMELEVWTILTNTSECLQPEISSSPSLVFTLQGQDQTTSKELMMTLFNNNSWLSFLPSALHFRCQLTHEGSSGGVWVVLEADGAELSARSDVAISHSVFTHTLEFNNTFTQLNLMPRSATLHTHAENTDHTQQVQHRAWWRGHDLLPAAPPTDCPGHQHSVSALHSPRQQGWDVTLDLESASYRRRGELHLHWAVLGTSKLVRALGSWSGEAGRSESRVELQHPFSCKLPRFSLHTITHTPTPGPTDRQTNSRQVHLFWDSGRPVNVSVSLTSQSQAASSRGQACVVFTRGQVERELPRVEGCVSVAREGNSTYSQAAEVQWADKKVTQSMNYQRGPKDTHYLQVAAEAENVSPSPCPSHSLLAHVRTNCRDVMEHQLQLDLCPPHPALSWSGYHRLNRGKELFYSQTGLMAPGHAHHAQLSLSISNSSTSQRTNYTILTEWQVGSWGAEVGVSAGSFGRGPGVLLQARLERRERVWLLGSLEKRCLRTAAGYEDGPLSSENVTLSVCLRGSQLLGVEAVRHVDRAQSDTLALVSMNAANQSLLLCAWACPDCLGDLEIRLEQLGSHLRVRLLERMQRVERLLLEVRRKAVGSPVLQELSDVSLRLMQRSEVMLLHRSGLVWAAWKAGPLRHTLTKSLPHFLSLLQQTSQLVQQELRKPLVTLAGAYHDVTGQRLEALWHEGVALWSRRLSELLPVLVEDPRLRAASHGALQTLASAVDTACQQSVVWAEGRLAAVLLKVRRKIAAALHLSDSGLEVILPLPRCRWAGCESQAGLMEVLLEDLIFTPLLQLHSISPTAEAYRLRRRLVDSPFNHEAFVVADQFVVTFDGHLLELSASCGVVLASDGPQDSFSVLLMPQRTLLVEMSNSSTAIQLDGEVQVDCHVTQTPVTQPSVTVQRDLNIIKVSNERGVEVSCDPTHSVCRVTLEGWLHGVSTGLLGTNDNEAGNDFPLPDGSQATTLAEFRRSWQVNVQCHSDDLEKGRPCVTSDPSSSSGSCTALFSSPTSALSSCFRVVEAAQFLRACGRGACGAAEALGARACQLAAAYAQLCHRNGVPVELPSDCV